MKHIFIIFLLLFSIHSFGQKFFKPVPPATTNTTTTTTKWAWRPVIALPAFKLVETSREDAKVDALMLTSTGGGVCFQKLEWDAEDEKWKANISFSPATILLAGNVTADSPIDLSYAMTVGFFNNTIMFGAGYDLGSVTGRSRWFGLISLGISFNN